MNLSVKQAVENAAFCYKTGGCPSCKKNLRRALGAITKGKKEITI